VEREMQSGDNGWRAALEIVKHVELGIGGPGWSSVGQLVEATAWTRRGDDLDTLLAQANGAQIPATEKEEVIRELLEKAGQEEDEHD
jgi:hypothetical protein